MRSHLSWPHSTYKLQKKDGTCIVFVSTVNQYQLIKTNYVTRESNIIQIVLDVILVINIVYSHNQYFVLWSLLFIVFFLFSFWLLCLLLLNSFLICLLSFFYKQGRHNKQWLQPTPFRLLFNDLMTLITMCLYIMYCYYGPK